MTIEIEVLVEQALESALSRLQDASTPPTLSRCLHDAVFPGGARIRPRLLWAVADACDHGRPQAVAAAAAAVELLHCASLVQDDMNCFDAADTRRCRPSLHRAFGAGMALLASDALIVGSLELLAKADPDDPLLCVDLVCCLSRHSGARGGITAGQAWESERTVDVSTYHAAKTGSLFEASVELGALCAGAPAQHWTDTGRQIGAAYQVADDLIDVLGSDKRHGKPVGVDASLGRPNIANDMGAEAATAHLIGLIDGVLESLPDCPAPALLRSRILEETNRLLPAGVDRSAA